MRVNDVHCRISAIERKERIEAALVMLQSLKNKVSELRLQCETLKKLQSEKQKDLVCGTCGKRIEAGQEVTLKDSFGNVRGYYHKDCFKAIWLSQTWTFDYSCPGFLRLSGKDK
ncbi:hypothetical protein G4O51_07695 [Candidatus Bathyarchaeota archaeon A05DMB-2]|jgi:hypothetical protein|nr:hypothetical protein [Candidatus Bathyarchaeota archaeon A05DMB-2]